MTYSITTTSGSATYQVTDGIVNTTDLDLSLIGKGTISYGSALNTNFLRLLENFANNLASIDWAIEPGVYRFISVVPDHENFTFF